MSGAGITKMTSVGMPRMRRGDVIQVWDQFLIPGSRASLRRVVEVGDRATITVRELRALEWYWYAMKTNIRRLRRWIVKHFLS